MKVEIIAGSARRGSLSKRVAIHLSRLLAAYGQLDVGIIDMHDHPLPPVQDVWQTAHDAPARLQDVATRIFDADAFILVSPEYNGSYSPAMKNFLDHFPKQERKVFGIVTSSPGSQGGIRAAMQLQNVVFALCGIGVARMLIVPEVDKKFTEEGLLLDPAFAPSVEDFVKEFLWLSTAVFETVAEERRMFNTLIPDYKLQGIIGLQ